MGKKGKEDEISNLMHVTVVRDASLPQHTKTSTALGESHYIAPLIETTKLYILLLVPIALRRSPESPPKVPEF